jgi:hypothetical protein
LAWEESKQWLLLRYHRGICRQWSRELRTDRGPRCGPVGPYRAVQQVLHRCIALGWPVPWRSWVLSGRPCSAMEGWSGTVRAIYGAVGGRGPGAGHWPLWNGWWRARQMAPILALIGRVNRSGDRPTDGKWTGAGPGWRVDSAAGWERTPAAGESAGDAPAPPVPIDRGPDVAGYARDHHEGARVDVRTRVRRVQDQRAGA